MTVSRLSYQLSKEGVASQHKKKNNVNYLFKENFYLIGKIY